MSKRRASMTMVYERPTKFRHLIAPILYNRKRARDCSFIPEGFKKGKTSPDQGSIGLCISDLPPAPKAKVDIYLHPSFWLQYAYSSDPREYAARDIQRVFKGWSLRQKLSVKDELSNTFSAMGI